MSAGPAALERFSDRIPEGIARSSRRHGRGPETVDRLDPGASRLVAVDGDSVVGYVAVVPLRLVEPRRRGPRDRRSRPPWQGYRALARHAVREALRLGLSKMVVEVVADQESTIALFRSHGFDPEALLVDHVRDRSGEPAT